jgi:TolB-like protein
MGLPRFLSELKRRKVYRVAVVYAAVGWALLEAADLVLPRLDFPDWTVNAVLAVVLLGFPLALVFAWVFDVGPQGIVRTEPLSPEGHHHRLNVPAIVEFVLILALVVAVGGLYIDRLSLQQRLTEAESAVKWTPSTVQQVIPNPEQYRAIAVLPFADMSEAGDQAWFAEGIAEELLIALSQVDELDVMARTSSFAFKNSEKTIAEIASILGVQAVLEGSVRRFEDRVRITAQLVDASSGYQIWSRSYERELRDIFKLQDELAKSIVDALQIELGVDNAGPLVAEHTRELSAYNWFMRGRALVDWSNPQNTTEAITHFENAVKVDPYYAEAWGYLAWARSSRIFWQPTTKAVLGVEDAYNKAIALNPEQSEALTAKAWTIQLLQWDWNSAGDMYQRAMEAKDNTNALLWYNIFLLAIDAYEQAIRNQRDIEGRDPLHPGYKSTLAIFFVFSGQYEAAASKALEALELNPRHLFALMALLDANRSLGRFSVVERLIQDLDPEILEWPTIRARVGLYYAESGNLDKAIEIYDALLLDPSAANHAATSYLALKLGKLEEALDLMDHLVEVNAWSVMSIRSVYYHRGSEALKNHPRYLALLQQIGLDDDSVARLRKRFVTE